MEPLPEDQRNNPEELRSDWRERRAQAEESERQNRQEIQRINEPDNEPIRNYERITSRSSMMPEIIRNEFRRQAQRTMDRNIRRSEQTGGDQTIGSGEPDNLLIQRFESSAVPQEPGMSESQQEDLRRRRRIVRDNVARSTREQSGSGRRKKTSKRRSKTSKRRSKTSKRRSKISKRYQKRRPKTSKRRSKTSKRRSNK